MDDPRRSFSYSVSLDRYISPSRIIEYESSIAVSYFPLMILTLSMIMFKPTTRDGSVKKVKGGSGAGEEDLEKGENQATSKLMVQYHVLLSAK